MVERLKLKSTYLERSIFGTTRKCLNISRLSAFLTVPPVPYLERCKLKTSINRSTFGTGGTPQLRAKALINNKLIAVPKMERFTNSILKRYEYFGNQGEFFHPLQRHYKPNGGDVFTDR
jgi:hypothetical protein